MSRLGKKPIDVPAGVNVQVAGASVKVSGPKTKAPLSWTMPRGIAAAVAEGGRRVDVTRSHNAASARALHGLSRALIANMVRGASVGYERRLLIFGSGYSCKLDQQKLQLNVGFMGRGSKTKPQFEIPIPAGLEVVIEAPTSKSETDPAKFVVRSADKQLLGDFVSKVRAIRPPEPYKGKGIRYEGEHVQRKAGKAFASGAGGK